MNLFPSGFIIHWICLLRARNRRYAELQRLLASSHPHFSMAAMKEREPLLHHQLVGRFSSSSSSSAPLLPLLPYLVARFLTPEERQAEAAVDMTNCSLTNIILDHMDINKERDDKKRMEEEEAAEEFDTDGEEVEEDDKEVAKTEGGREFLRQEFVNAAYQVAANIPIIITAIIPISITAIIPISITAIIIIMVITAIKYLDS